MTQPPNDQPDQTGRPAGQSGDQPSYGQPGYGQPPTGQPTQPYGTQPQYPPQQGWSQPSPAQYGSDIRQTEAGYAQMYGQKQKTGMSVAAMVLGILAILLAWFPIGSYVAVLLALLALIFGIVGVRRGVNKGMAVTGIVLGAIALIASIVMSIIWTIGFRLALECADEVGTTSGPAFEACLDRKADELG